MSIVSRALGMGLVSVAMAVPALAQSKPFAYTPGTQRYRMTNVTHPQRDQTGGRAPLEYDYTTTQYVQVTLSAAGKDALDVVFVVDSITIQSDMNAPPPDYSWAKGAKLIGRLALNGRVIAFAPPANAEPNIVSLYAGFRDFLPVIPAPITDGATWADTTNGRFYHRGAFDSVLTQKIINSKIAGDTTFAGQKAWRLERNGITSLSGAGTEGGKPLSIEGDGTIRGVDYLSPGGIFLGAKTTQSSRFTEAFKESGEGAPSAQTIRSTIEPLPPVRTASVAGIR